MFVRTIKRKSSHRNIAVQIVEPYRNDKGQPRLESTALGIEERFADATDFLLAGGAH